MTQIPKEYIIQTKPGNNVINYIENSQLLTLLELEITNSSPIEILSKIHSGQWSCVTVLNSFIHRCYIIQQLTNPITEWNIEQSLSRAKDLDDYYKTHNNPIGPLHGLPISFKDEFDIKGFKTTLALKSRSNSSPLEFNSPNVQTLYNSGCIPFIKTNVPTGVFNIVTINNVFGRTSNPYNTDFNIGGSSGGEASLIALKGSPLGVGSDLGGSIRQPSSQVGVYGFKPSSNRVPHYNSTSVVNGLESLNGTNGPLCRDVDGLKLYLKSIIDDEPWLKDTKVVPIPWNDDVPPVDQWKFAILKDDGLIKPLPPISRALDELIETLRAQNVEVVEWEDVELIREISQYADIFMDSNGYTQLNKEKSKGDESITTDVEDIKVSKLWDLQHERYLKVNQFWNKWQSLGINGLITPVSGLVGFTDDGFKDFSYSPFANVIDFPSVTFPVTIVDKDIDIRETFEYRNKDEQFVWERYEPSKSHGLPVNLQLIGAKYQEETLLKMCQEISSLLS